MLGVFMTVLHLIPGLSSLATAWLTAAYSAKVAITTAQIGGDVAVATSMVNAAAVEQQARVGFWQVASSSNLMMFLIYGFSFPWIFYETKVVVWDTCLGWGSTPAVHGDVMGWATTIIACLFGSGTIMHAGSLYFHRPEAKA